MTILETREEPTLNFVQQSLVHEESGSSTSEKSDVGHGAMYQKNQHDHKSRDGKRQHTKHDCQWKPKCF